MFPIFQSEKFLYHMVAWWYLIVEMQEHIYSLKFIFIFMEDFISPKQGITKSLIHALNTLSPQGCCENHGM